jgi:hypothetical protein
MVNNMKKLEIPLIELLQLDPKQINSKLIAAGFDMSKEISYYEDFSRPLVVIFKQHEEGSMQENEEPSLLEKMMDNPPKQGSTITFKKYNPPNEKELI